MENKSDSVIDENKYNKNMSSLSENEKFFISNEIYKTPPSSPENLSDAFIANLLSKNEELTTAPNKTDNSESCNNTKNLNSSNYKLKDNSTDSIGNPNLTRSTFIECFEKIDSGRNIEEHSTTNNQESSINSEGSPNLIKSSFTTSDEKNDFGTNGQEENKAENMNQKIEEESPSLTEEAVKMHNENTKPSYREEDSFTDDDSSSTFSLNSSSDCSDSFLHKMQRDVNTNMSNKVNTLKTKGELDIDELPPIQDLQIDVNESDVEKVGKVHAIVEKLVIVRALKSLQPLDIDSVLFLTSQKPLGRIFDVFGPVSEPFYTVRFNNVKNIQDAGVEVQCDIFYAPQKEEITTYVFVDELKKQKGSDASWKDNNEPPEEFIDYSDDEQEKVAKQKRRAKSRPKPFEDEAKSVKRDQPEVEFIDQPIPPPHQPYVSQQQNLSHNNYQSPGVQFRQPQTFVSQPQRNLVGHFQSSEVQLHPVFVSQWQQNPTQNYQPSKLPFRQPHPIILQTQQNLTSRPPTPFGYQSPPPPQQSTYQFHQSPVSQPARYPNFYMQQQAGQPKPIPFQQPHVFGQMTPIGPMSPALQRPPVVLSPTVMSPVSIPPASPNFSYFSHKYVSAPSPPPHGHVLPSSPWFQGQAANGPPRVRYLPPLSPLSIQIPNTLRTPPPTMPGNNFNAVSPMQLPQNGGHYMHQPGTRPY